MTEEPKSPARGIPWFGSAILLIPILVICGLWLPVLRAYYVSPTKVDDEVIKQALESPSDSTLEKLKDFDFLETRWESKQALVDAASSLLHGDLRIHNCSARITMPFSAQDLAQVPPGCKLPLAGFVVPDLLLRAYEASGRGEFLSAAEAVITSAHKYEQAAWFPRGQFWNDHAVAARVSVLANFWRLYRHSKNYRPEVAWQVLQMVAHSAQLLAKPDQFTFATNHGIMQNLALWHASLAFPSLPHMQHYQRLAFARMNQQMKYYISDEGVVLEHSAGYQSYGVRLLGWAFQYLDLMHQTAPREWIEKYDRAKQVYGTFRRPDGSLPLLGDTDSRADAPGPLVTPFDRDGHLQPLAYDSGWRPAEPVNLFPVSGYSVWWDGLEFWPNAQNLSQSVVTWSNFSGHGHKHADELSVFFWAGGQSWWSNVGYWPYDTEGRAPAESWAGSNAPHLVGESSASLRVTKLLSIGHSDRLTELEVERAGVENYIARRQVIHCKPNLWVVLDNTSGSESSQTTTTWTAPSAVRLQQRQAGGSFLLETPGSNDHLDLFVLGSQGTVQKVFRGSSHPFVGWQVEGGVPVPASALVVEQPARNSWAAVIWSWEKAGATAWFDGPPRMTHWTNATNWEIQLPGSAGGIVLHRQGNRLGLHSDRGTNEALELMAPPDVNSQLAELRSQFAATASQYHHFSGNIAKRTKVTWLLMGIFLLQQIFFVVYKRIHAPRLDTLEYLSLIAWIVGGIWLAGFYF